MQDERSPDALSDAALAREIEAALAVEPSPEFVAGVRARLAQQPAAADWTFSWRWAAAVAAVLALALVVMNRPVPRPDATASDAGPVRPEVAAVRPGIPGVTPQAAGGNPQAPEGRSRAAGVVPRTTEAAPRAAGNGAVAARVPRLARVRSSQPLVLIPAAEQAAMRRLLRSGLSDVVELAPTVAEPLASGEGLPVGAMSTPGEIAISPIAIEPLPPAVSSQGERQ